ncbi:MAG: carbohydrate ABC transporter permease [Acetobacteraceae bacterium]
MTERDAATAPELLSWDSRARRVVTVYIPLAIFVIVMLFPFYWMTITAFKPDSQMENYKQFSPFWVHSPTLKNFDLLLFHTQFPRWMMITMIVAVGSTVLSIFCSVLAAYAIERLRFRSSTNVALAIYLAYLVPPTILFIPLAYMIVSLNLYNSPLSLILTYPTFLIPFCTWLLIGYFKSIPFELEECAVIDGASRLQILRRIILPLATPGLISAGIFAFTLSWNEVIYALAFIQSTSNKTVPVAVLTDLVTGDVYQWGSLMAGALLGSVPVALLYSLFVEYYVSSLTGAVKE